MCPLENHSGSGMEERPGQGQKLETRKLSEAKMKQSTSDQAAFQPTGSALGAS